MPFAFPNAGQRAEQKSRAGGDFGRSVPGDGGGGPAFPGGGGPLASSSAPLPAAGRAVKQSTREFSFSFFFFFSAFKIIY